MSLKLSPYSPMFLCLVTPALFALVMMGLLPRLRQGWRHFRDHGGLVVASWRGAVSLGGGAVLTLLILQGCAVADPRVEAIAYGELGIALVTLFLFPRVMISFNTRVNETLTSSTNGLVDILNQAGLHPEAAALGKIAFSKHPDDVSLAENLAMALSRAGQIDEARAVLAGLPELPPARRAAMEQKMHPPKPTRIPGCVFLLLIVAPLARIGNLLDRPDRAAVSVQLRSMIVVATAFYGALAALLFLSRPARSKYQQQVLEDVVRRLGEDGSSEEAAAVRLTNSAQTAAHAGAWKPRLALVRRNSGDTIESHRRRWIVIMIVGIALAIGLSVAVTFWPEATSSDGGKCFGAFLWLSVPTVALVAWICSLIRRRRQ